MSVSEWADALEFVEPKAGDHTGFLRVKSGARSFQLVGKGDAPLIARAPVAPLECVSIEAFMDKNRGQLTLPIKMTSKLWASFHALDQLFDAFMVKHATKLFSATDAKFIKDDPKSITLKHPKPLARHTVDGAPDEDMNFYVRVYGRGPEVESFVIKDTTRGPSISKLNYRDQFDPLPYNASSFAMCTGTMPDGRFRIANTVRTSKQVGDGGRRMRIVSPGDFNGGHLLAVSIVPQHWAIVNGSASLCLRLVCAVFENVDVSMEIPSGFVVDNESASDTPLEKAGKREREEEEAPAPRKYGELPSKFSSHSKPEEGVVVEAA